MEPRQASRFVLFVVITIGILFVWNKMFPPPAPVAKPATSATLESGESSNQESQSAPSLKGAEPQQIEKVSSANSATLLKGQLKDATIENDWIQLRWKLDREPTIHLTRLKKYSATAGGDPQENPFLLGQQEQTFFISFSDSQLAPFNSSPFSASQGANGRLDLVQETPDFRVERFVQLKDGYSFDWGINVISKKGKEGNLGDLTVHLQYKIPKDHTSSLNVEEAAAMLGTDRKSLVLSGNATGCPMGGSSDQGAIAERWTGPVKWASLGDRYFMQSLIPTGKFNPDITVTAKGTAAGEVIDLSLIYPVSLKSEKPMEVEGFGYFGPKTLAWLSQIPDLKSAIDLGTYLHFIAEPILLFLNFIHNHVVGNYGVAIILLTLLIRIMMIPLIQKQMKSMKKMQELGPEMARLKEKYGEDKQKLNIEMMKIMKENNVNPLGGCLPLLLQMPIFFSLWRALGSTADLYHAPFIFWIRDLSAMDPYYVLPILMAAMMLVQQLLSPQSPQMDKMQRRMFLIMPLLFSFIMFQLPSGLCLYMVVSTGFGIVQQMLISGTKKPTKDLQPITSG